MSTSLPAGVIVHGYELPGYVTSLEDVTSANTDAAGTETVGSSIQFVPVNGVRYKVSFDGNSESTVVGDSLDVFLRWKHTNVVDVTGTQIRKCIAEVLGAASRPVSNVHFTCSFVATASTMITVVCSFRRRTGSGTAKMAGNSGYPMHWEVEVI